MKRLFCLALVLLTFAGVLPSAVDAQSIEPLDWIPADFSGYVRLSLDDPSATLDNLNIALLVASVLQPLRATFAQAQNFDPFIPVDSFDVENASFTADVLPWLHNEVVFAYRRLDERFVAGVNDKVIILPTQDSLEAGAALSKVIQGQDFPKQETYQQVNIYQGDKTSFAFMPSAVLVGPVDLLHEVIDTMAGNRPALTADPVYQQVQAQLPAQNTIAAYLAGDSASSALGVLMSGGTGADPILAALTESLADLSRTPDRLLLAGALDGIGVTFAYNDRRTNNVNVTVALHTREAPDTTDTVFDASVLDLIPRSAMLVQSGGDAGAVAADALHALPFLNFAGAALAAFPVAQVTDTPLTTPSSQQAQDAVTSFLDAVEPVVDVQSEILDKISGSYALALLPRPNNVLPGLNAPFDLLLVAQTDSPEDAQAVEASAGNLIAAFVSPLESEPLGDHTFQTLRVQETGEPLVSVGAVDNLVIIGTGQSAQLALDAQRGDNRLITQARWKNLSADGAIPYVYADVNALYNTFLPSAGGPAVRPISQLGIQSQYLGDNLFRLDMLVVLTS